MSEIKNVGYTWMANCNQLTLLSFKGLNHSQLLSFDVHYILNHYSINKERKKASTEVTVLVRTTKPTNVQLLQILVL